MTISGKSSIAGNWQADADQGVFTAFDPSNNKALTQEFTNASAAQVAAAAEAASDAFFAYSGLSREARAEFLEAVAEQVLALGDDLIHVTMAETGLPEARLQGERMRTVNQLKLFANKLRNEDGVVIEDQADPERAPLPKPATRLQYIALGPVAVFGASNFPYAFSVLGGDTASALAAGCPVVVKGHPAHPATSEMMATAINKAIAEKGLPAGVFSLLQGQNPDVSHQLVAHPKIKAVGFTGSLAVAKHLQATINQRAEPIPFYGELGSINPQIALADKVAQNGQALAQGLVQSLMMGQGQFCTSPGLWLVPAGSDAFAQQVAAELETQASGVLLTQGIANTYQKLVAQLTSVNGVEPLAQNKTDKAFHATACVAKTSLENLQQNPELKEEVFGPFALLVEYQDEAQLIEFIDGLEGQLTASIHGEDSDLAKAQNLALHLAHRVGRLIFNQMPTGVEVCASMIHGGPFPASTDVRTTSVGSEAMQRFLRPVCLQNLPVTIAL